MNKRRLLKLADLLEADAANKKGVKFDLGEWATKAGGRGFDSKDEPVPVSCHTSACAMGLAAISGAFKRAGLSYEFTYSSWHSSYVLVPTFDGEGGFDAASKLFDIDWNTARHLFDPQYYRKTKGAVAERAVARRIRKLVAGGDVHKDAVDILLAA